MRLALTCLLARGHLLIEDIPGVGKTTLAHALARVLGLSYQRIQFTSDLLPADVIGISVYDRESGSFKFHRGPVFAQLVMADEVNRATPKAQSALLEAMEERQVTIDGESHALPEPFFIVATQNPSFQVGTFPLPESQIDRFLMRIELGYPAPGHERQLLRGRDRRDLLADLPAALDPAAIPALQKRVTEVHASDALLDYVQALARASRDGGRHQAGLSPRAVIALLRSAQAWALPARPCRRASRGPAGRAARRRRPPPAAARCHRPARPVRGRRGTPRLGADPLRAARHSAAYAVKRALRGWLRDWIRRRQGPDGESVTLRRGRIYILPTGLGLAFGRDAGRDAARFAQLREQPRPRADFPARRAGRRRHARLPPQPRGAGGPCGRHRTAVRRPCGRVPHRARRTPAARRAATSRPCRPQARAPRPASRAAAKRRSRSACRRAVAAASCSNGSRSRPVSPTACFAPGPYCIPVSTASSIRGRPRTRRRRRSHRAALPAAARAAARTISRGSRTTTRAIRHGTSPGRRMRARASSWSRSSAATRRRSRCSTSPMRRARTSRHGSRCSRAGSSTRSARGMTFGLRLPGEEIPPEPGESQRRRCLTAIARFEAPAADVA